MAIEMSIGRGRKGTLLIVEKSYCSARRASDLAQPVVLNHCPLGTTCFWHQTLCSSLARCLVSAVEIWSFRSGRESQTRLYVFGAKWCKRNLDLYEMRATFVTTNAAKFDIGKFQLTNLATL